MALSDPDLVLIKDQVELLTRLVVSEVKSKKYTYELALILDKYETASNDLKSNERGSEKFKFAENFIILVNMNLPNITKGALNAASAFDAKDYMNGSAAIMDICSTCAYMLGGISAGLGPYGAVFGAIFTLTGQILSYFGPQQPSLIEQIEEALRTLDADNRLQWVKSDGDKVEEYTTTILRVQSTLPKLLMKPIGELLTGDKDKIVGNLTDHWKYLEEDKNSIEASWGYLTAKYGKWESVEWLKDEKCQENPKWPEILGVFCRVYSDSITANTILSALVNEATVKARINECHNYMVDDNYKNYKHFLGNIMEALTGIIAIADSFVKVWNDGNKLMLKSLDEIHPVAQDRGLFVYLGNNNKLYAQTGRKILGDWKPLDVGDKIGKDGYGSSFTIIPRRENKNSLEPQYYIFLIQHWTNDAYGNLYLGTVKPSSVEVVGNIKISAEKYNHISALPIAHDPKALATVYAAHENDVTAFKMDQNNGLSQLWHETPYDKGAPGKLMNIRSAITIDKEGKPHPNVYMAINFGTYRCIRLIKEDSVDISNNNLWIGVFNGIDVNSEYLWVYGSWGIVCTTHDSALEAAKSGSSPDWNKLFDLKGQDFSQLHSLSACKDGTLLGVFGKTIKYTTYTIDKNKLISTGTWVQIGGEALQAVKMPNPSFSLFESLKNCLDANIKRAQKLQEPGQSSTQPDTKESINLSSGIQAG